MVVRSNLLFELSYATVLPITTQLRADAPNLRIDVAPSRKNGLHEPSQVMVDWPQTVRASDVGAVIGHLDAAIMQATTRPLALVLGIGDRTGGPRTPATRRAVRE